MNAISTKKKSYIEKDDQYIVDNAAMSNIELHDNGIGEDVRDHLPSPQMQGTCMYSTDMRGTTTDARNLYSAEEEDESTSLYFPQAASLYDTAHEMDPPMWGDNLDDLTTGMLSDNEEFLNLMSSQNDDDIIIGGKSSSDLNTTTTNDFKDMREEGDQPVAGGDSFIDFYKDTDLPIHMDTLEDNLYTIGVLPPQVSEKSMNITDGELLNDSYTMSNSSKGSVTETLNESTTEEEDEDDEEKTSLQEPTIPTSPTRCLLLSEKKKQVLNTPPSEPEDVPVVTPQALKTSPAMLVPRHSLHGVSSMQPLSSHTPPGPTIGHSLNNAPKIRRPHTPPGSPPPPELSTFNPFIMRRRVSQEVDCGSMNNHEIAKAWQQRFAELEEFTRLNGHCNVPQKYDKNPCLGSWVSRQRTIMREFDHDDDDAVSYYDRIICLKSLGLKPSVGRGKGKRMSYSNWDKNFADLIKYRDTNGHCDVNTKTSSLGRWVGGQRNLYKKHNDETGNKGKDLHHDKELEKRFLKLKDAGFKFSIGKGSGRRCSM